MLSHFKGANLPTIDRPVLIDDFGIPRYWAAVWVAFLPGGLASSTLTKRIGQIEALYRYSDSSFGRGHLDDAIGRGDINGLSSVLEGYFLNIKNAGPVTAASEDRWQSALQFILETTRRLYRTSDLYAVLGGHLSRFELLNSHLHVGKRRRPERIRSLPAVVVETLYGLLDPESPSNPYRTAARKWRVYALFILLLHQGLRPGEVLVLPTDVIKEQPDPLQNRVRYWMTVRYNEYEEEASDPRYSKPSIKNALSVRQIPVSEPTAQIVNRYIEGYRGKPNHSFLMNSQKRLPLSPEGVKDIFQSITASLPPKVRKALRDHTGKDNITAHDLRHTCAVVRLNQMLSQGVERGDALERMRVFFGWSKDSEMPLRYARAVFEERLAAVWNSKFDERVEILRNLSAMK